MGHDDAAGLADAGGDGFPVVGIEGAQVEDFNVDSLTLSLLRGLHGTGHKGAIGDERDVDAGADDFGLAEGDGELGAGIGGAAVGFAVEALVLEKQDRIVAANGGAEESVGVERVGGEDDSQAGGVGEDALARLRVVDGAAGEVAADGYTNHRRRGPCAVGAPAHQGELVANLVHGRPDVVEELNLDDGLHAAGSVADGPAYDIGFSER